MNITQGVSDDGNLMDDGELANMQDTLRYSHLPLIVLLILVAVIGIIGNIVSAAFHVKLTNHSTTIVFIIALSITDVLVCIMVFPNVKEMLDNVNNKDAVSCKITHFLGHCFIATSCLFIWLIAIDRHRKVCYPFGRQFTRTTTKYSIIGIVIFAFCVSSRNVLVYDIVRVYITKFENNETVTGYYCTTRSDDGFAEVLSVFATSDFVIILAIWMTTIITYTHIIIVIVKMKRRLRDRHAACTGPKPGNNYTKAESKESVEEPETDNNDFSSPATSKDVLKSSTENANAVSPADDEVEKKNSAYERTAVGVDEIKLALMMCVVSALFIACFIPYFVIRLLHRLVYETGEEYELGIGKQLGLKLVYMNSAFNPIVYVIFNRQFRMFIKYTASKIPLLGQICLKK